MRGEEDGQRYPIASRLKAGWQPLVDAAAKKFQPPSPASQMSYSSVSIFGFLEFEFISLLSFSILISLESLRGESCLSRCGREEARSSESCSVAPNLHRHLPVTRYHEPILTWKGAVKPDLMILPDVMSRPNPSWWAKA